MARNTRGQRHTPKLTRAQVMEMRRRVRPGGDLFGLSPKSVGHHYRVGPGEVTKALAGTVSYQDYPPEGRIEDQDYLRSSIPRAVQRAEAEAVDEQLDVFDKEGYPVALNDRAEVRYPWGSPPTPQPADEYIDEHVYTPEFSNNQGSRGRTQRWFSQPEIRAVRADYLAGKTPKQIARERKLNWHTVERMCYGRGTFGDYPSLAGTSPISRGKARQRYNATLRAIAEEAEAAEAAGAVEAAEAEAETVEDISEALQLPEAEEAEGAGTELTPLPAMYFPLEIHGLPQPPVFDMPDVPEPMRVLSDMLRLVPPESLGWVRRPVGRPIGAIVKDALAGYEMLGQALEELAGWAAQFEETQQEGM